LVLIAEEEERSTLARSRRQLRARVDGLKEAFLEKEVDDTCGGFEALAQNVDDEDAAVEHVGEIGLSPASVQNASSSSGSAKRASAVSIVRLTPLRSFSVYCAAIVASYSIALLSRRASRLASRSPSAARTWSSRSASLAVAIAALRNALVENVVVEPLERVRAWDVEEDGQCRLRARDRKRKPEGRVALALPEQLEGGFEEPGGGVGREAVE